MRRIVNISLTGKKRKPADCGLSYCDKPPFISLCGEQSGEVYCPDGRFVPAIALAVTAPEWGLIVLEGLAIASAAIEGIVTGQAVRSKINEARENKAKQAKQNLKDNAQAATSSPAPQNQDGTVHDAHNGSPNLSNETK